MSYEEFKKTLFYTRENIVAPIPNQYRISKSLFIKKNKYDFNLEDEYLRNYYEQIKTKLK